MITTTETRPMPRKKTPLDPKRAIGVIRVSTDDQKNSPEVQRDALEAWCKSNKVKLVAVYEDLGVSGGATVEDRPGLAMGLASLHQENAGTLLVAKVDRFFRNTEEALAVERDCLRQGARVTYADGTPSENDPDSKFMRTIFHAAAERERGVIRARTKAAFAMKKARGLVYAGVPPYGWENREDGKMVQNPAEQKVIRLVQHLKKDLQLSERAIVDYLNKKGLRTRSGGQFVRNNVVRILKRLAEV